MTQKTPTIGDLLLRENQLFAEAERKHREFFSNTARLNGLLLHSIKEIHPNGCLFIVFLSQLQKHHTLAWFSAARLHHVQMVMNLRQVLESSVNCCYALAFPEVKSFAKTTEGILIDSDSLRKKRFDWLDNKYPEGSKAILRMKKILNQYSTHSNIVDAQRTFKYQPELKKFDTPFFDHEDEYLVQSDFWLVANTAIGALDIFFRVNQDFPLIILVGDFKEKLVTLSDENQQLKAKLMQNPRFKKNVY